MEKISIIVPVYNAEKYIERCLKSIIEQSYDNKEIIVINDGSTDQSEDIIKKYTNKIKYIKRKNSGIAATRNLGIQVATGNYIMFVDSDDYIENDLLEKLKPYIEQNIEMIKYKAKKVTEEGEQLELIKSPVFEATTGEEAFSKMCFLDQLMDIPWLYLYKKELLIQNKFEFPEGLYHEDFGVIPLVILKAKTFISTDICGYNYVQSQNSIMRNTEYSKTVKKAFDSLIHYDNMEKQIQNYGITQRTKENVKIFYTNSILLRVNELSSPERKKIIKEIRKRKMTRNIKVRSLKQLVKRIILEINIPMYLRLR